MKPKIEWKKKRYQDFELLERGDTFLAYNQPCQKIGLDTAIRLTTGETLFVNAKAKVEFVKVILVLEKE